MSEPVRPKGRAAIDENYLPINPNAKKALVRLYEDGPFVKVARESQRETKERREAALRRRHRLLKRLREP